MERLQARLDSARAALDTLLELTGKKDVSRLHRDAAIQRFEYTFEAVWKAGKAYLLEIEGLNAASPKKVIRACLQTGIISEEETHLGLQMVDDRNLTAHTYHEKVAEGIYRKLAQYADLMRKWLSEMDKRAA